MRFSAMTALLCAAAFAGSAAHAQIYLCQDASGRTLTSDMPIPECADRSMRVYGKTGVLKREIAAPLTPEEKRQKQLQEAKEKAAAAAAEEQRKSDHAMLARYRTEADINAARARSLDIVQEQKKRESIILDNAEMQLKQAQSALDAHKKKQSAASATIADSKVDDYQRRVEEGRKRVKDYDAEIAKINLKFDQTVTRFRELTDVTAALPHSPVLPQ